MGRKIHKSSSLRITRLEPRLVELKLAGALSLLSLISVVSCRLILFDHLGARRDLSGQWEVSKKPRVGADGYPVLTQMAPSCDLVGLNI